MKFSVIFTLSIASMLASTIESFSTLKTPNNRLVNESKKLMSLNEEQKTMSLQEMEFVESLNKLTENVSFKAVQFGYGIGFLGLIDAGFSGDWVKYGFIDEPFEIVLKKIGLVLISTHLISAFGSAFLANKKDQNSLSAFSFGLFTGFFEILKSLGLMTEQQKIDFELSKSVMKENEMPPLQTEISSLTMSQSIGAAVVMLSTSITVKLGSEQKMRKLLLDLADYVKTNQKEWVYTMAVNQDPDDRKNFFVLQRFANFQAMSKHQTSPAFKEYIKEAEKLIEKPMGLYLVNERKGRLTEPVYPFGPGGEGGLDDAVYSSPANLQGSQARGKVEVKTKPE